MLFDLCMRHIHKQAHTYQGDLIIERLHNKDVYNDANESDRSSSGLLRVLSEWLDEKLYSPLRRDWLALFINKMIDNHIVSYRFGCESHA